jgi:hypothetical protein
MSHPQHFTSVDSQPAKAMNGAAPCDGGLLQALCGLLQNACSNPPASTAALLHERASVHSTQARVITPREGVSKLVSDRLERSPDNEVAESKCDKKLDGSDGRNGNAVERQGRKGISRKNFSKGVVDHLQSWFYANISHP